MRGVGSCSCCSCGCLFFVLPVVLVVLLLAGLVVFIISLLTGNANFYFEPYSWESLRELVLNAGIMLAAL